MSFYSIVWFLFFVQLFVFWLLLVMIVLIIMECSSSEFDCYIVKSSNCCATITQISTAATTCHLICATPPSGLPSTVVALPVSADAHCWHPEHHRGYELRRHTHSQRPPPAPTVNEERPPRASSTSTVDEKRTPRASSPQSNFALSRRPCGAVC